MNIPNIYMKKQVMTSIDEVLHKKAQDKGYNISHILENALQDKLNKTEVAIPKEDKCEFCGRDRIRETEQTINQSHNGLTWLFPDEKWICNSCLSNKFVLFRSNVNTNDKTTSS